MQRHHVLHRLPRAATLLGCALVAVSACGAPPSAGSSDLTGGATATSVADPAPPSPTSSPPPTVGPSTTVASTLPASSTTTSTPTPTTTSASTSSTTTTNAASTTTPSPDALGFGDADVFEIAAADAERVALAAMPDVGQMAEAGWEPVVDDDTDDDDGDFDAYLEREPACARLAELSRLADLLGDGDIDADDGPVGLAERTFSQLGPARTMPTEIEFEVEIASDVDDAWSGRRVVADLIGSDDFGGCIAAVIERAMVDEISAEGMDGAVGVEVTPLVIDMHLPDGGVSFGVGIEMTIGDSSMPMVLQVHSWLRGNAEITVILTGDGRDLMQLDIPSILTMADRRLVVAATR